MSNDQVNTFLHQLAPVKIDDLPAYTLSIHLHLIAIFTRVDLSKLKYDKIHYYNFHVDDKGNKYKLGFIKVNNVIDDEETTVSNPVLALVLFVNDVIIYSFSSEDLYMFNEKDNVKTIGESFVIDINNLTSVNSVIQIIVNTINHQKALEDLWFGTIAIYNGLYTSDYLK